MQRNVGNVGLLWVLEGMGIKRNDISRRLFERMDSKKEKGLATKNLPETNHHVGVRLRESMQECSEGRRCECGQLAERFSSKRFEQEKPSLDTQPLTALS